MSGFFSSLFRRLLPSSKTSAQPFLAQWSGQSLDELLEMRSKYRIDSLVLALEQAIQLKEHKGAPLSDAEITLLSIEALEREVNNGGFFQFFENDSNQYAARIVQDLSTIGCRETSQIVSKAIKLLKVTDLQPATILKVLGKGDAGLSEKLEELDEAFFAYPDDISGRLMEFVVSNKSDFKLPDLS